MNTSKPVSGAKVNFLHPMANGLVGLWLFNEGAGSKILDLSGNNNTGTMNNMLNSWTSNKNGIALDFDGSNDYIDITNEDKIVPTSYFTVSAWVKAPAQNNVGIASRYSWQDDERSWFFCSSSLVTSRLEVVMSEDGTFTSPSRLRYYTSVDVFDDTLKHVAFTFNKGTLKLFVDGKEDTNKILREDDSISSLHNSATTVAIGASHSNVTVIDSASYIDGTLSDIRIWERALEDYEIASLYEDPYKMFSPITNNAAFMNISTPGLSIPIAMHNYRRMRQ